MRPQDHDLAPSPVTIRARSLAVLLLALVVMAGCTSDEAAPTSTSPIELSAAWERLTPPGPDMAVEFSMVYVPEMERTIAYGGRSRSFTPVNATWAYDHQADVWTDLEASAHPPWRMNHALAYHPGRGTVLMFGGDNQSQGFDDLWEYSPTANAWTEITTTNAPDARQMHGMAYSSEHDSIVVFGGRGTSGGAHFNDTWALDLETSTWRDLDPPSPPPVQDHVTFAYSPAHSRFILFESPSDRSSDDATTWTYDYDANTWTALETTSQPRSDHSSIVYDPASTRTVLIGNMVEGDGVEAWALDLDAAAWTLLSSTSEPTYREHFGVALDTDSGRFVMSGGFPNNDPWALTLTAE